MQKSTARTGNDFRHAPDVVSVFVHNASKNGEQRRFHAVTVINVEVIPAAFRCKLLDVQANCAVRTCLDQPRTFYVRCVVAETVENCSWWLRQPKIINPFFIIYFLCLSTRIYCFFFQFFDILLNLCRSEFVLLLFVNFSSCWLDKKIVNNNKSATS